MLDETSTVADLHFLHEASKRLLGYFVHTSYANYLKLIEANFSRWHGAGMILNLLEAAPVAGSFLFDFNALDTEKLTQIIGVYLYILACHKGANYRLMNRFEGKQVLYLRGYDFEGSLSFGGNLAMGFSSVDSSRFNRTLAGLLSSEFQLFKVLSPKDLSYEAQASQRYFYGDFDRVTQLAQRPYRSIYLNALSWKEGVLHVLDRMDHFVVYVSSVTDSALWELEQLSGEERRSRVTVIFDDEAIKNKDAQINFQSKMQTDPIATMLWSKRQPLSQMTVDQLRGQLSKNFLLTTPQDFTANIDQHRRRIAASSAVMAPGMRETHLDFSFYPALDSEKLIYLRDFSAWLANYIAAATGDQTVRCLPLFLNYLQLRIYTTLLLGEHDEAGRALAGYQAVAQSAFEFYSRNNVLSGDGRDKQLGLLQAHCELANYSGTRLLAYGRSDQFDNLSAAAVAEYNTIFEKTKSAVECFMVNR